MDIDNYGVEIDAFCFANDIDDYDLDGHIMVGDNNEIDDVSDNIKYE